MNLRRLLLTLLALFCFPATTIHAQQLTVRGVVIGPDAKPVADQVVVLHRVSQGGGETVAQDTSSADGRFVLVAPATEDTAAVYFVAGRFADEMYLVPPFRADEGATDQILQVGVPGTSASSLLGSAPGVAPQAVVRPATSRRWLLFAIPLVAVAAVAIFLLLPGRRISEDRAALIRIAELDERMPLATAAQREQLGTERATLIARLRGN